MKPAIQLLSIKRACEQDLNSALAFCREAGYEGVEFYADYRDIPCFGGIAPEDFRALLNEHKLEHCSSLVNIKYFYDLSNMETIMAFHDAMGCKRIVMCYADVSTQQNFDEVCQAMHDCNKLLHDNGFQLYYHNHLDELKPFGSGYAIDEIIRRVENLAMEPDLYWLDAAGISGADFIKQHPQYMVDLLHVKDGFSLTGCTGVQEALIMPEMRQGILGVLRTPCPIGLGDVDLASPIRQAKKMGVQWVIYENDVAYETLENDKVNAAISARNLINLISG